MPDHRKQGFSVSRTCSCFRGKKEGLTWQNSIESISAVPDSFHTVSVLVDKELIGYGITDKRTGDIPQIAVHADHRSRGIGRNLLSRLIRGTASSDVELINIDDDCQSLKGFLEKLGIENFVPSTK